MGSFEIVRKEEILQGEGRDIMYHAISCFLERDFEGAIHYLEEAQKSEGNHRIAEKLALLWHLVGEYEKAKGLYQEAGDSVIGQINYYAFCHRFFEYAGIRAQERVNGGLLWEILQNNLLNYYAAVYGVEGASRLAIQDTVYSEQILNDWNVKRGLPVIHKENDRLINNYKSNVVTLEEKTVLHKKKRTGIFVTDIQRHKDAAVIYELADILEDYCDVYIYFNNIFENKLLKQFANRFVIRHVIHDSYEGINNLFYEDEIEVCIDTAELGLRNNNLALCLLERVIGVSELLMRYPVLLQSKSYFPDFTKGVKAGRVCVLGDLRCIYDEELRFIHKYADDGMEVIFESPSFDERLFQDYFNKRLVRLGYRQEEIRLFQGIRPFAEYLGFISGSSLAILPNGASHVELSETVYCGIPVLVTSNNPVIRRIAEAYGILAINADGLTGPLYPGPVEVDSQKAELYRQEIRKEIQREKPAKLAKVYNRNSLIAYVDGAEKYCINNTCNGDIVVFR